MSKLLNIFFLVCLSFAHIKRNVGNTVVPSGTFSPNVKYDLECQSYTDCFNCTISDCHWNGKNKKCDDNAKRD